MPTSAPTPKPAVGYIYNMIRNQRETFYHDIAASLQRHICQTQTDSQKEKQSSTELKHIKK